MTHRIEPVSEQAEAARVIAAVRATLPIASVPHRFREFLDQVYAAGRAGLASLDGQNIFVYHPRPDGHADVDFGVGVRAPFTATGAVVLTETPAGRVATTTLWGDYAHLGDAHAAITAWCQAQGRRLAGPRWEVYGHWHDNPAERRTDVYALLAAE